MKYSLKPRLKSSDFFKRILISIFITLNFIDIFAQANSIFIQGYIHDYENGEISIRTGKNDTTMVFTNQTVPIKNKHFTFDGRLLYPNVTRLLLTIGEKEYHSDIFYISPGSYHWDLRFEGDKIIIHSDDPLFKEYEESYRIIHNTFKNAKSTVNNKLSENADKSDENVEKQLQIELNAIKNQELQILKDYICSHPTSYIGLFELLTSIEEYDSLSYEAYKCLDKKLRKNFHGEKIHTMLTCSKSLEIGGQFPNFILTDTSHQTIAFNELELKKYNLIEFWHSGCGACITQFPTLISLHDKYGHENLSIIQISGDIKSTENRWKEVINKHQLNFPQYWDVDHLQASQCLIRWYPTNFLLDKNGVVLAKNIKLEALEQLLKDDLR